MSQARRNVELMTYAIQAEGLVKRFGETQALTGVDLTARPGTVLGDRGDLHPAVAARLQAPSLSAIRPG